MMLCLNKLIQIKRMLEHSTLIYTTAVTPLIPWEVLGLRKY